MLDEAIFIGGGGANYATAQQRLLKYANRHGLIAGATGTGKTVTLQIMAEAFSAQGVPVFLSDVKGDLSGLAEAGSAGFKLHDAFMSRAQKIGLAPYEYRAFPVSFWDIFGEKGPSNSRHGDRDGACPPVASVGIDRGARGSVDHCLSPRG